MDYQDNQERGKDHGRGRKRKNSKETQINTEGNTQSKARDPRVRFLIAGTAAENLRWLMNHCKLSSGDAVDILLIMAADAVKKLRREYCARRFGSVFDRDEAEEKETQQPNKMSKAIREAMQDIQSVKIGTNNDGRLGFTNPSSGFGTPTSSNDPRYQFGVHGTNYGPSTTGNVQQFPSISSINQQGHAQYTSEYLHHGFRTDGNNDCYVAEFFESKDYNKSLLSEIILTDPFHGIEDNAIAGYGNAEGTNNDPQYGHGFEAPHHDVPSATSSYASGVEHSNMRPQTAQTIPRPQTVQIMPPRRPLLARDPQATSNNPTLPGAYRHGFLPNPANTIYASATFSLCPGHQAQIPKNPDPQYQYRLENPNNFLATSSLRNNPANQVGTSTQQCSPSQVGFSARTPTARRTPLPQPQHPAQTVKTTGGETVRNAGAARYHPRNNSAATFGTQGFFNQVSSPIMGPLPPSAQTILGSPFPQTSQVAGPPFRSNAPHYRHGFQTPPNVSVPPASQDPTRQVRTTLAPRGPPVARRTSLPVPQSVPQCRGIGFGHGSLNNVSAPALSSLQQQQLRTPGDLQIDQVVASCQLLFIDNNDWYGYGNTNYDFQADPAPGENH